MRAFQKFLERTERKVQSLQGKGFGTDSLAAEVRSVQSFLPTESAVVFDVGANKGLWTRELLKQVGSQIAEVHAFEPSRHNFSAFEGVGDSRVNLVKSALGAKIGTALLHYDRPGSGLASLSKRGLAYRHIHMDSSEEVDVTTLDAYVEQRKIGRIDFAKFDIEGHELDALRGAEYVISSGVLRALSFEFGGANIDTRTFFKDFFELLVPLGFEFFRINPWRNPTPVVEYRESLEVFTTTNYIASRRVVI